MDQHKAFIELCRRDPEYFRNNLLIDGPNGVEKWGSFIAPFQKKDFKAMDPALMYLAGVSPDKPKYQRFFIQRSRGSSKTTDIAVQTLWFVLFCQHKYDGVCAAEDKEQAGFLREQMLQVAQLNPWVLDYVDIKKNEIENKHTHTKISILTSDVYSSFGLTPYFTICDEFSHWTKSKFWHSIVSSFNKKVRSGGILIVACNAGAGNDWKFAVKEQARESDLWYHSAPDGYAPWYKKKDIEEQRKLMPRNDFDRLWMNRWQASVGEFVTVEEADRCINPDLKEQSKTHQDGWRYIAAVDYAEKNDRTVGVVTHVFGEEEDIIYVDRMDVIDPEAVGGSVRLEWVEQWVRNVHRDFGGNLGQVFFIFDEYQLLYLKQKLVDEGFWIESFDFAAGKSNWELSLILRQLILHQRVQWYEGCGKIYDAQGRVWREEDGRNDLSTELGNLIIKKMNNGKKWRFDHTEHEHDDRAFALGAACRFIVDKSGGSQAWNIQEPSREGKFSLSQG